jgi:hypothetical protein
MKTTAAILTQWRHQDPDRLLQTALRQAQRLAEMSPELQRLGAENAWLSQQLEAKTKRIVELEEALEAAHRAAFRQAAPFRICASLRQSVPDASTDIPALFASNPITSTSTLKWLSVFVLTAVADTLLIRPR